MGCADAPACVAIKIFVEVDVVAKLFVLLKFRVERIYRPRAGRILEKYPGEAVNQFLGDLIKGEILARASGTLDLEVIPVIVMELLQRLDDQEVDWKPDRAAPIGVASKQARPGFRRLIIHLEHVAVHPIGEWVRLVIARNRSHT